MQERLRQREAERAALLVQITAALEADKRFRAAWLTGSFGRGEQDALSDLDLTVVVDDADARTLCRRPWQVAAGTTSERREMAPGHPGTRRVNEICPPLPAR